VRCNKIVINATVPFMFASSKGSFLETLKKEYHSVLHAAVQDVSDKAGAGISISETLSYEAVSSLFGATACRRNLNRRRRWRGHP
jgi:hypothetical protein